MDGQREALEVLRQALDGSRATVSLQRCRSQTRGPNAKVEPTTTKWPASCPCLSGILLMFGLRATFVLSRP